MTKLSRVPDDVEVNNVTALEVTRRNGEERLGWIIGANQGGKGEWVAIATVPRDGRDGLLGIFPYPYKAFDALMEHEGLTVTTIAPEGRQHGST